MFTLFHDTVQCIKKYLNRQYLHVKWLLPELPFDKFSSRLHLSSNISETAFQLKRHCYRSHRMIRMILPREGGGELIVNLTVTQHESGLNRRTYLCDRIFKNSEPSGMNIKNFLYHVYRFCRFKDARSTQISSFMEKFWKSYPSTAIKVTKDPYVRNFT